MRERRCDCIGCFAFRVAGAFFLLGFVALMILGALLPSEPPFLVDQSVASGSGR